MMLTGHRLDLVEGIHNHSPGDWGRRLLMTRIPNIPASVTVAMTVVVFLAPIVVMLVLRSPS